MKVIKMEFTTIEKGNKKLIHEGYMSFKENWLMM